MNKKIAGSQLPKLWLRITVSLLFCSALVPVILQGESQAEQRRDRRRFKKEKFALCKTEVMSDEVLVKFEKPINLDVVKALASQVLASRLLNDNAVPVEEVGTGETLYLIHADDVPVRVLLDLFNNLNTRKQEFSVMVQNDIKIERSRPNFVFYKLALQANDPFFQSQWGLRDSGPGEGGISAVSAWKTTTGSDKIVVGVVDTGVAFRHTDLDDNMWRAPDNFTVRVGGKPVDCRKNDHGFNASDGNCVPDEPANEYHGTHVAGILGAEGNNNQGVTGVNWTTRIMGLRFGVPLSEIINAVKFAIEVKKKNFANVRVLNNSYGYKTTSLSICRPDDLADAISEANDADILFVAAAGNNGTDNDNDPFYPASLNIPSVISVAATDSRDGLWKESNYGAKTVHIGAPGVDIISTRPPPVKPRFGTGTSFAAPFVSGAAALILSKRPMLTTAALKDCILNNADRIKGLQGHVQDGRRLNVYKAIQRCGQ